MPIATRLTNAGTLLVNGSFDENTSIAPTKFRTTSTTVFASELDEFTGAPVVDSSLKLWLDAGQTASYSGSGTTWTDLSGNANNGTLVNAPTFISNDGGGCIQLDGTNDHITLPVTGFAPPSLTIDYWIKRISDNGYFWIVDNTDNPELRMLFQAGKLQIYFYDDGGYFSTALSTTTFSTGSWYNITVTLTNGSQNVYINGNQEIITTTGVYTGGPSGNAGEHTLGTYNRPGVGYGGYANVRIGSYRFYNRALTAAEVIQNYNALQSRYGLASITATQMPVVQRQQSSGTLLVNGEFDEFTGAPVVDSSLQLWLDAGQTTSYSGSGSTWTDLSSSGRNTTLNSSPVFSTQKGGQFILDGSTQYLSFPTSSPMAGTNLFTYEIWVNFNQIIGNFGGIKKAAFLMAGGTGTGPQQPELTILSLNNTSYTPDTLTFGQGSGGTTGSLSINVSGLISNNNWYQIVLTRTGSASQIVYLNGTQIGTGSVSNSFLDGQTDIGGLHGNATYSGFLSGSISNIKIYNRALSSDEISTNFNALRGRYGI